jgi:hypothetical protein
MKASSKVSLIQLIFMYCKKIITPYMFTFQSVVLGTAVLTSLESFSKIDNLGLYSRPVELKSAF